MNRAKENAISGQVRNTNTGDFIGHFVTDASNSRLSTLLLT